MGKRSRMNSGFLVFLKHRQLIVMPLTWSGGKRQLRT